jgi:O-antigen ligase
VVLIVLVWGGGLLVGFESALALSTIGSFAAVVVGLARPVIGVFGVGMLSTLDAASRVFLLEGGLWRWNTVNYWLLVVMVLSLPYLVRLKDGQSRILQAFLLLLTLELAVSADRRLGAQHILGLAVLFGLLVYFTRAARDEQIWYWLGVVNGTLAAATGLVFYLQIEQLPYINPNAWAYVPLTGIFAICLGLLCGRPRLRAQITLLLLATVNVVWIFLSGSRGTLLIAVTSLVILAVAVRPHRRRAAFLAGSLLVAIAITTQFAHLQALGLERVGLLFDPDRPLVSRTSGRSDLMIAGWNIFLSHPLGVGTGGFSDAWADLGDLGGRLTFERTGEETQAHSAWFKTLAENGVPGIVLLAAFVGSFAVVGWRRSRRDPNLRLLGLLVTAALSVGFVSAQFQGKGPWFLAAAAMTLFRHAQRPRPGRLVSSAQAIAHASPDARPH